jgi:preprotein translocase subunit SecE
LGETILASKDKKPTAKPSSSTTRVTRISANDGTETKKTTTVKKEKVARTPKTATTQRSPLRKIGLPFMATGTYFKGAWYELKQVRWPDRGATWGMTGALLGFTAFFVVFILLLDALFKYLFKLILG